MSLNLKTKLKTLQDVIFYCSQGTLLCDIVNRLEGRNPTIKGI